MTKPWEEAWTYDGKFGGLVTKGESVILESSVSDCLDGSYERARLAAAAPDMARALMAVRDCNPYLPSDILSAMDYALKKAGVKG